MTKQVRAMLDRVLKEAKHDGVVYPDTPEGNAQYNADIGLVLELLPHLIDLRDCWCTHISSSYSRVVYSTDKFRSGREETHRNTAFQAINSVGNNNV